MLNRFGKDIETIDSSLASSLQTVNSSLASFFASVITVAWVSVPYFLDSSWQCVRFVFPLFLLPAAVFGFVYRELAVGYLNTGRDLRRMESNSRSPIFSDFGELLEGIVTVRAFSAERRFLDNLHTKIDMTTRVSTSIFMYRRILTCCRCGTRFGWQTDGCLSTSTPSVSYLYLDMSPRWAWFPRLTGKSITCMVCVLCSTFFF